MHLMIGQFSRLYFITWHSTIHVWIETFPLNLNPYCKLQNLLFSAAILGSGHKSEQKKIGP